MCSCTQARRSNPRGGLDAAEYTSAAVADCEMGTLTVMHIVCCGTANDVESRRLHLDVH